MYEIAPDHCDCAVCKAYGQLREVFEGSKSGNGKLLAPILDLQGALTSRNARLLLQLIQRPHLQYRFAGQVFCYGDEQRGAFDLLHVRDGAYVVGVEGAHDLEGLRQDADDAIGAPDEDALGAGDDAGSVPGLRWVRRALFEVGSGGIPRRETRSRRRQASPATRRRT